MAQTLTVIFGGPAVLFLIIVHHEVGHATAGIAGGLRFEMLAAGPFVLRSVESGSLRRLEIGLHRQSALLAGFSVCLPPGEMPRQELRRAMLLHVSGGPLASLLAGTGLLAVGMFMPAVSGWASVVRALFLLMGTSSLLVGLFTAIPSGGRSLLNDGARWRQLARGGEKANRDLTLLGTSSRSMAGEAPRYWNGDHLRKASLIRDSSVFELWTLRYLWLHHWDSGRLHEASTVLQRTLRLAAANDPAIQDRAALDAVRFCQWALSAPEAAERWLGTDVDASLTEDPETSVARFFEAQSAGNLSP